MECKCFNKTKDKCTARDGSIFVLCFIIGMVHASELWYT